MRNRHTFFMYTHKPARHKTACNSRKVSLRSKKMPLLLVIKKNSSTFAPQLSREAINIYGALTERLGSGLQNRPRQFESARHLRSSYPKGSCFYFLYTPTYTYSQPARRKERSNLHTNAFALRHIYRPILERFETNRYICIQINYIL